MYKLAALFIVGVALNLGWQDPDAPVVNPEMERQEIVNLESRGCARDPNKHRDLFPAGLQRRFQRYAIPRTTSKQDDIHQRGADLRSAI